MDLHRLPQTIQRRILECLSPFHKMVLKNAYQYFRDRLLSDPALKDPSVDLLVVYHFCPRSLFAFHQHDRPNSCCTNEFERVVMLDKFYPDLLSDVPKYQAKSIWYREIRSKYRNQFLQSIDWSYTQHFSMEIACVNDNDELLLPKNVPEVALYGNFFDRDLPTVLDWVRNLRRIIIKQLVTFDKANLHTQLQNFVEGNSEVTGVIFVEVVHDGVYIFALPSLALQRI